MIDWDYKEVIALGLSVWALGFFLTKRDMLCVLSGKRWLGGAVAALCLGFACSLLETLFWGTALNAIEHFAYGGGTAALAWWTWRYLVPEATS